MNISTLPQKSYKQNYILIGLFVLLFLPIFLGSALTLLVACLIFWPFRHMIMLLIAGIGVWLLRNAIQTSGWLVQQSHRGYQFIRREIESRSWRLGQPMP